MVAGGSPDVALARCLGRCDCRRRRPQPVGTRRSVEPACYPAVAARECREGLPGLAPARESGGDRLVQPPRVADDGHRASGRGVARRSGRRRRALSLRHHQPCRPAAPGGHPRRRGREAAGPEELDDSRDRDRDHADERGSAQRGVPVQCRRSRPSPPVLRTGTAHAGAQRHHRRDPDLAGDTGPGHAGSHRGADLAAAGVGLLADPGTARLEMARGGGRHADRGRRGLPGLAGRPQMGQTPAPAGRRMDRRPAAGAVLHLCRRHRPGILLRPHRAVPWAAGRAGGRGADRGALCSGGLAGRGRGGRARRRRGEDLRQRPRQSRCGADPLVFPAS